MPLVAPVMKAVVTWVSLIAWFQSAAWADAAKPRKPAKRKDKLSKARSACETYWGVRTIAEAENPRKRWENGAFNASENGCRWPAEQKQGFRNAWPIWSTRLRMRSEVAGLTLLSGQASSYR
jgi:hypothetical protein